MNKTDCLLEEMLKVKYSINSMPESINLPKISMMGKNGNTNVSRET